MRISITHINIGFFPDGVGSRIMFEVMEIWGCAVLSSKKLYIKGLKGCDTSLFKEACRQTTSMEGLFFI